MKLDKDLVREILLAIEASTMPPTQLLTLELPNRTADEISYHALLLSEAGFIEGKGLSSWEGLEFHPRRLTYKGHEFLDTIRDAEVWKRTKAGAEKAGNASVSFVWELAKAYGKHVASERLGISFS